MESDTSQESGSRPEELIKNERNMRFDPEIAHWLPRTAAAGLGYTQV